MEQVKFLGQISTIMRSLTSKVGDFLSHFDNVFEKNTAADFNSTSFKQILIHIHKQEANKGKIKGQLKLEIIFEFCKTFKKILKNLGIHLTLKTNVEQNFIFTTKPTDINVTIGSFYLFVPRFFPKTETQVLLNESIESNYTITYYSWYTERKLSTDGNELRVDIDSAQHVNIRKYLNAAFQTAVRILTPRKINNKAFSDNVIVGIYFSEIDGYRYPREAILKNFPEND